MQVGIKTTHKYRHQRMIPQRELWADGCLWFSDEEKEDVIFATDNDTYSSNAEKGLFILKYFADKDFDWLVIACDDTYLNIPNIEKKLKEFDINELQLIGNKVNYWAVDPGLDYVSGMCIIMNKKTLTKLVKYLGDPISIWDDVDIGILARKAKIKVTHINGIYPFKWAESEVKEALAIHKYYVK